MINKREEDQDMSMEEILASIRKYVIEEQKIKTPDSAEKKLLEFVAIPPKEEQPFDLTEDMEEKDLLNSEKSLPNSDNVNVKKDPTLESVTKDESVNKKAENEQTKSVEVVINLPCESEETFLSEQTVQATTNSLHKLLNKAKEKPEACLTSSSLTLDQFISDLARPLIKEWLDVHLPSFVENIVSKEIERLTKKIH